MYLTLTKKTALLRDMKYREFAAYFIISKHDPSSSKEALAKLRQMLTKDDYLVIVAK